MSSEHILVINALKLASLGTVDGKCLFNNALTPAADMADANIGFGPIDKYAEIIWRPFAEKQVPGLVGTHRQFINYGVLTKVKDGVKVYAVYQRVKGTSENRLMGRFSIGFGGHPTVDDIITANDGVINIYATLHNSLIRELEEEINLVYEVDYKWSNVDVLGYIHSTQSEVDSLHFAVVTEVPLNESVVIKDNEESMCFIGFRTAVELKAMLNDFEFENWSKFIIDAL